MLEALQGAGRRAGAGAGGRHTSIRSASAMNRSVSAASNSINTCEPVRGQRDATRRERGRVRTTVAQHTHPGRWSAVQPRGSREASHGHALRRRRHQHRRRRGRAAVAQDAGCARRLGDGERQRSARATRGRCTAAEHAGGGTRQPPARGHRHLRTAGLWALRHCTRHTPAQTPVRPV